MQCSLSNTARFTREFFTPSNNFNNMYPNLPPVDPATGQPYPLPHAMAYPGHPFPQPGGYPYQQGLPVQPLHPGVQIHPTPVAMGYPSQHGYPNVTPTAVPMAAPSAPPAYGFPGAPTVTPTPYAGMPSSTPTPYISQPVINWVRLHPKDAGILAERAIVAGYEGHDGSPLWIIRAPFRGDVIPGKLAIKHHAAYVAFNGDEHRVEDIEVCCAAPEKIRWLPSRDGNVPPNAVVGGNTSAGEPLYIGRVHHEKSLTPGKVHQSHKGMYISFAGKEISLKVYEVLCTV